MEIKQVSKNPSNLMFEVGKYVVRIFKKPGRKLCTCTCFNGTMYCNEPTICKHKIKAIKFMAKEPAEEIVDEEDK